MHRVRWRGAQVVQTAAQIGPDPGQIAAQIRPGISIQLGIVFQSNRAGVKLVLVLVVEVPGPAACRSAS